MPPDVRRPPQTGTGTFEARSDVCGGPLTGTNIAGPSIVTARGGGATARRGGAAGGDGAAAAGGGTARSGGAAAAWRGASDSDGAAAGCGGTAGSGDATAGGGCAAEGDGVPAGGGGAVRDGGATAEGDSTQGFQNEARRWKRRKGKNLDKKCEECLDHHRRRDDVGFCCGTPPVSVSLIGAGPLMTRRVFIRTPLPSPVTAPHSLADAPPLPAAPTPCRHI